MVDDNLHYSGDYAEFSLQHQSVVKFIADEKLWFNGDINEISTRRSEVVKISSNRFKNVGFLAENKLIFMFQKNIVKNIKSNRTHEKYSRWFDFAIKTRNKNNILADFKIFLTDKIFRKIINRLLKDNLSEDDKKYLESEDENIRLTLDFYERQEILMAKQKQQGIEQGINKERTEQKKLKIRNYLRNIKSMRDDRFTAEYKKYEG